MKKNSAFRRAAALMAALSITVSLAAPAFAGTYYIDDGDIIITKKDDGSQEIKQNGTIIENDDRGEIIITTFDKAGTTLESDLEGPAAEDSGFGPVVEDNYQPAPPAQPEDAEEPKDADQPEGADQPESADQQKDADQPESADQQKDADQPESTDQPEGADQQKSADQQAQPQQAAPAAAAAPAASTPVHKKENGFWGNTITVINKAATALKLTLKDVKIDVSDTDDKAALRVQGDGNVEIELDGNNELKSGWHRAGLEKNASEAEGTLTLKDDNKEAGSLTAKGGGSAAGIGGSYNGYHKNNGTKNIIITGGTVNATGGQCGAGIGGGSDGGGKNITISGGTVTAAGGNYGAGIGGGDYGSGEDITINGGTVTATGGFRGAGIGGGGDGGGGKNITINRGTVNATGGDEGAGIGGGHEGSGEHITIKDGTVNAAGGSRGSGIGGGAQGSGKNITIKGGTVNAAGGNGSAGIGGGSGGSGENITINGGAVDAKGGNQGAGIGGGVRSSGENITISGGTVTAAGGYFAAGIGGGSGSNVTVSGAAQVTAVAGKSKTNHYYPYNKIDSGATIGNGSRVTSDALVNGEEIQADISGLMTTGYIHHIIYNEDGSVKQEWREFGHLQPAPDTPNAPAEESNEVDLGIPWLYVETLEGSPLPFNARQQGSTLRVTTDNLSARLYGTRQALEALREQGVEQIQFVTSFKTTTLPVEDLLAEGGSWFALEHNGLVSRRLSAAQAESLKCRMR